MINFIKNNLMESSIGFAVIVAMLAVFAFGNNDTTERTVIECPITGSKTVKFDNGIFWSLGCKTTSYNHVLTDELDGGINVRYRDGGKGGIDGIVRVSLPNDEETMLQIHRDFRDEEGIRNKLLRPEIKQALNLTAGMVTSEEAYATKRDNIQEWASDQIENGIYNTEVVDLENGDTKVIIHKDESGQVIYNASPFTKYGIKVSGFQVTDWSFEPATEEQIQTKRRAEMAEITAKSEAQTAKQEAITVVEQGKKAVAEEEYRQKQKAQIEIQAAEREAAVAVIEAEKVKQVNALAEEAAKIDVRTAKLEAKAKKERADAEAYAKEAIIMADGALDKKLAAYIQVQKEWAAAYAKRQVPQFVMGGEAGSGGNADTSQFQAMLNALVAKDLVFKPEPTK